MRKAPMKMKCLLAAVVAATLAACGGGGSGGGSGGGPLIPYRSDDGASRPDDPGDRGVDTTSAPCVNEADLHAGTTVEAEQDITTPLDPTAVAKVRVTTTTFAREAFAGANPVRFVKSNYDYKTDSTVTLRAYRDVVGGNKVEYGSRNGADGGDPNTYLFVEPPIALPVSMTPGQKVEGSSVERSVINGETTMQQASSYTHTYVGRETLETPMGSFKVCKFLGTRTVKLSEDSSFTFTIEDWVAAEGPYRGQNLKFTVRNADNVVQGGSFVVTKLTYTPK